MVDVELRPLNWLGVSLLGMQEYDKRHADQGIGVTLGERPLGFYLFSTPESRHLLQRKKFL
ncbi:MAG: hypothetical protein ACJ0DH_06460 [bacterium]